LTEHEKKPPTSLWTIRSTTQRDRPLVASLLSQAPHRHLHLDWYTTYDFLDESPSLIAFDDQRDVALLACPPDTAGIGWIRHFAVSEGVPTAALWELLWKQALSIAPSVGITTVSALITQSWFIPHLQDHGFSQSTEVIFLEWKGSEVQVDLPLHATLRTMTSHDLDAVANVDKRAFQPLWQHSIRALDAAFEISTFATVVEVDEKVVAYQMSTSSALGAHLARLAVDPKMQSQGLAKALVTHALRYFQGRGIERMSVNTQADNTRSQVLYERLGFTPTGQRFPVFTYKL
jgi:ribosomal protein S18 acetylase RimI-like enzyme